MWVVLGADCPVFIDHPVSAATAQSRSAMVISSDKVDRVASRHFPKGYVQNEFSVGELQEVAKQTGSFYIFRKYKALRRANLQHSPRGQTLARLPVFPRNHHWRRVHVTFNVPPLAKPSLARVFFPNGQPRVR